MITYQIARKPPSFPAQNIRTILSCLGANYALESAQQLSKRNKLGSYGVYAVDSGRLLRGAIFKAGQLIAIGQKGDNPYAWDWGEISLS